VDAYRIALEASAAASGNLNPVDLDFIQSDGLTQQQLSTGVVQGSGEATASGFASVDLATGQVKVKATATIGFLNGGSVGVASGMARASLEDSLTFFLPTGVSTADINFSMLIDGDIDCGLGCTIASTFTRIQLGGVSAGSANCCDLGNSVPLPHTFGGTVLGVQSGQTLVLQASIQAAIIGNGTIDFGNTATISFDLPTGVTFTSQSGVFLTQSPTADPIPEPSTILLFGTGIAGLGAWRYRKRKKV